MTNTTTIQGDFEVGMRIRSHRETARMSAQKLADALGISRGTINNYENGKTEPSAADLFRIAQILGCRIETFLGDANAADPPRFAFRAHAPLKKDPSIIVAARKFVDAYREIEEITDSKLDVNLRKFDWSTDKPLTDNDIETAADTIRQTTGLHDTGPENIASVLEGVGVRTLFFDHNQKGLEGISTIQGDAMLVLLRNRTKIVERTIFSAAHELAHLVLHPQHFTSDNSSGSNSKQLEKEADKFAGNFLVPRSELTRIWQEEKLYRLRLFDALIMLKRVFHVSFHCLYHRVVDLELHTPMHPGRFINEIKSHLGITGKATMEELEPDPLKPDILYKTTRFSRLVRSAFLQELIGVSKVAELFQVTVDEAKEITHKWLRPRYELVEESAV